MTSLTSPRTQAERRQHNLLGWGLLSPALVLLSLFAFFPLLATVWDSFFTRGTVRHPSHFTGLDNYREVLADPHFWQIAGNNLWYAAVTVPVSMALALGMALWANAKIGGRGLVRTAFFTPTMLPMIAAANLWLFFYTPGLGLLDHITALFGLGPTNWLGQPGTALWSVMAVTVWKESGFFMLFYLAALQAIPPELREAARLEGAGRWATTRRLVLPLLMPTTLFVLVNALINAVRLIDHLFILTRGGPDNASKLMLYWIWETAFAYLDPSSAAVMTVLVIAVLALIAALQFLVFERRIHYR